MTKVKMNKNIFDIIGSKKHPVIFIFLLSLVVRFIILIPVIKSNTPLEFDERAYYKAAVGFHSILRDLVHFESPQAADKEKAYGKGVWPPFQSILLALGFFLFGKSIVAARIIMVLISAMTTPLVFLLTTKLSNKASGVAASLLHLFYPSFLAFSHYLWSETLFIFLLLLAVYLVVVVAEAENPRKRVWLSIFLGVLLGLLVLTRAAALFMLAIFLLWIFLKLKNTPARIYIPVIIIITLFFTIFPWEYTLVVNEKRFVLFSNFTYRNLYVGNNQWNRYGREIDQDLQNNRERNTLRNYAKEKSIHLEQAARELALKEITSNPGAFVIRSFNEFLLLWTFDFFPLRHIFNVVYPPMTNIFVLFVFFIFVIGTIFLYLLIIKGFFIKEPRIKNKFLILALVVAGVLPYILAYGHTRYNLPQVALLLPIAGLGLANFRKKTLMSPKLAIIAGLCLCTLFFYTYNQYIFKIVRPSSYYQGSINLLDSIFKTGSTLKDTIIFRSNDPAYTDLLTLTIPDKHNYSFDIEKKSKRRQIRLRKDRTKKVIIFSKHPTESLLLTIHSKRQNKAVRLKPISRKYWNKFLALEMESIELKWKGGR
ncbi:MAG: glycosyltransferase family 39 protein [Candidatus Aminicenantes bacterium]|jgi:4-amino-4-deoxy-L-arabinose transferase-like glycosyltransferase